MKKNTRDYGKKFEDGGAVDRLPDYRPSFDIEDRRRSPYFYSNPDRPITREKYDPGYRLSPEEAEAYKQHGTIPDMPPPSIGAQLGFGLGNKDKIRAQREGMAREQAEDAEPDAGYKQGGPVMKRRR